MDEDDYYAAELYAEDPELFREWARSGMFDTPSTEGLNRKDYE